MKRGGNRFFGKWVPQGVLFDPKQFWMAVLLLAMFAILWSNIEYNVAPGSYINFLTFIGAFYVGGSHLTDWFTANQTRTENNVDTVTTATAVTTTKTVALDKNINTTVDVNPVNDRREPKDFPVNLKDLKK